MQYIQSTLLKDEKLIYATRPHWIVFFPTAFYFVIAVLILIFGTRFGLSGMRLLNLQLYQLLSLAVFVMSAWYFLSAIITYLTSEYGVTDRRVLMKIGWIRRYSIELFLDKVEAILVNQSIAGRVIGYGTLTIIGTGGSKDPYRFVPTPLKFRKIVQQQTDIFVGNRR